MLQLYLYLPNLLGAAEGGKGGGLLELLGIDFNILIIQLVGFPRAAVVHDPLFLEAD
jgi:hypothetical protein